MDLALMLAKLYDKETSQAYENLKELEALADSSDDLYPYLHQFVEMVGSENYAIRVRGFRLLCKQAKWDSENIIDNNLDDALAILDDDKPTAVRQALAALHDVVLYKRELRDRIREKAAAIDYLKYKETMHRLIAKDIQNLLDVIS